MPRYAVNTLISDYELRSCGSDAYKYAVQNMQHQLGSGLISALSNVGKALVSIEFSKMRQESEFAENLALSADIVPVDRHTERYSEVVLVPHFEYFPMDWICSKCGCIIDGITHPRMCSHCGAPKLMKGA